MRAALLPASGQALEIVNDIECAEAGPGQVRVKIHFCGLCHSDYSFVGGDNPSPGPMIPGHEASGVVESVGDGVNHLKVGDKVVLTPAAPCGHCYFCQRNEHSLCVNASSIMTGTLLDGSTGLSRGGETVYRGCGVGGLAEYAVMPATGAVKVDADVPLEVACVIGCAVQTGYGAVINTASVEAGATVLIMGLGGIGLAAVQAAKLAGASLIIASDPVAERREAALQMGAHFAIDPLHDDLPSFCMEKTAHIGLDYAFETAGIASLAEQSINLTRAGGTTVCVGSPSIEESITIPHAVIFGATEKKLCGCLLGSCNSLYEIPRLISLWKQGLIDLESLITARRPLEQVNEGFDDLHHARGIRTVIEI